MTISTSILNVDYRAHLMNLQKFFSSNDRDPVIRYTEWMMTSQFELEQFKITNNSYFSILFQMIEDQNSPNFCSIAFKSNWINTSLEFCENSLDGIFKKGFDYALSFSVLTLQKDFVR